MVYFLIAVALIVTFIGVGYAGLSLITRSTARDGAEAATERHFAVKFFWLGLLFIGWNIIDPLTALAYRLHEIHPMVQDCRTAGNGDTCRSSPGFTAMDISATAHSSLRTGGPGPAQWSRRMLKKRPSSRASPALQESVTAA